MNGEFQAGERHFGHKFRDSFRGVLLAVRAETNFRIHFGFAVLVAGIGAAMRLGPLQWCVLTICIAIVLATETMNCALERLAKAVDRSHNPDLAAALDMASGAVLLVSTGSAVAGVILFTHRLGQLLDWWAV